MQQELSVGGQQNKARISATITVAEARTFAKYYGKVLSSANQVAYSEETLRHFWDALYYCRWVILKNRVKE